MPRTATRVNQNSFQAGKISDSNPINPVEGGLREALNVDISLNGRVGRRLGIEVEDDFNFPYESGSWLSGYSASDLVDVNISQHKWRNVNEESGLNFRVFRVGNDLYIYDEASTPYSDGFIDRVTIPSSLLPEGVAASQAAKGDFDTDFGKGFLFCAGTFYEPFYISYDGSSSFSLNQVNFNIRDFEGISDGLDVDEHPTTLSVNHQYNLHNQGWPQDTVRDTSGVHKLPHVHYFEQTRDALHNGTNKYPSNADIWFLGQTQDGNLIKFNGTELDAQAFGATPAPKGHFIYNLLESTGRRTTSGLNVALDSVPGNREAAVAFYAGRVWWKFGDRILYSKIIESVSDIDIYYPENDPTAEEDNAILDTDGGFILSPEIGTGIKMTTIGASLLLFSERGIFSISGVDGSFTANDQSKREISQVIAQNNLSIVKAQNSIYFWAEEGIFQITEDPATGFLVANDISKGRISVDYNSIPAFAKKTASGFYDSTSQRVYWSYSFYTESVTSDINNKYTNVIIHDLIQDNFWDYSYSNENYLSASTEYPIASHIFKAEETNKTTVSENVVTSTATLFILGTLNGVYSTDGGSTWNAAGSLPNKNSSTAYMSIATKPSTNTILIVNREFKVWRSTDSGINWTSVAASDITGGVGGSYDDLGVNSLSDGLWYNFTYASDLDTWILCLDTGFATSTDDGDTWVFEEWSTNHTSAFEKKWAITYHPDCGLVGVAANGSTNQVLLSTDLSTFTLDEDTRSGSEQQWQFITYIPEEGVLLACGGDQAGTNQGIIMRASPPSGGSISFTEVFFSSGVTFVRNLAYSTTLGRILAKCDPVGGGTTDVFYSDDGGLTWSSGGDAGATTKSDVFYISSIDTFFILESDEDYRTSSDGLSPLPWTDHTALGPFNLNELIRMVETSSEEDPVVDGTAETNVCITYDISDTSSKELKVLLFLPDATASADYRLTFGHFSSREFKDWVGLASSEITANANYTSSFPAVAISQGDYDSVVEVLPQTLGEPSLQKNATYVYTYFDYIRGGYNAPSIPSEFDS